MFQIEMRNPYAKIGGLGTEGPGQNQTAGNGGTLCRGQQRVVWRACREFGGESDHCFAHFAWKQKKIVP